MYAAFRSAVTTLIAVHYPGVVLEFFDRAVEWGKEETILVFLACDLAHSSGLRHVGTTCKATCTMHA